MIINWALLALIVFGIVLIFVKIPGGALIYGKAIWTAQIGGYRVSSGHRSVTLCNGCPRPWAGKSGVRSAKPVKAVTANVIELPGDASVVLSSAGALGEHVLAQPRGRSGSPSPRGAKRGANAGRRQATPGDSQPWLVQLDGPSGHTQQRPATGRMRLKSGRPAVRPRP
jgi:hypothetical protein